MGNDTFTVEKLLPYKPQEVWRYWVQPDLMTQWWGPKDFTCHKAHADVRQGGTWRVDMTAPDGNPIATGGEYLDVRPGERLHMTFAFDRGQGYAESSEVVVQFEEANGQTRLLMTQTGCGRDPLTDLKNIQNTWRSMFEHLAAGL